MPIRTYQDFEVSQEAYAAALETSKSTRSFPGFEQFELAKQLRRAARSIRANIVEGWAKRNSVPEFRRYLQVAIGSCDEVKHWLEMSRDEGYGSREVVERFIDRFNRIGAMLASLWKRWRSNA